MEKSYTERAKDIAKEVADTAGRTGRKSIFSIENTAAAEDDNVFFPPMRYAPGVACGVVKIATAEEARRIAESVDGIVDIVLIDVEKKMDGMGAIEKSVRNAVTRSRILTGKLNDMTVDAADALISILMETLEGRRAAIIGGGNAGSKLALKLVERGADTVITRRDGEKAAKIAEALNIIKNKGTGASISGTSDSLDASKGADILICFAPKTPVVTEGMVNAMKPDSLLIDGGIGTIHPEAIKAALGRGMRVLRLDMRCGFSGGITTILETESLINEKMGKGTLAGLTVVAGGLIGDEGDVVVDSISKPTQVIGIADGCGGLIHDADGEYRLRAEKVRREIGGSQ